MASKDTFAIDTLLDDEVVREVVGRTLIAGGFDLKWREWTRVRANLSGKILVLEISIARLPNGETRLVVAGQQVGLRARVRVKKMRRVISALRDDLERVLAAEAFLRGLVTEKDLTTD